MEYGIERRITPHSNLGATMLVGIPFGVTLKVKFTRASQTYTFPIHLADEVPLQFDSILLVLLTGERNVYRLITLSSKSKLSVVGSYATSILWNCCSSSDMVYNTKINC